MDEEAEKEEDDSKWMRDQKEKRKQDEEKTAKRRAQRNRRKNRGKGDRDGTFVADSGEKEATTNGGAVRKPLQIPKRAGEGDDQQADGEARTEPEQNETGIVIHDDD